MLNQDIADKIDTTVQEKLYQLKPLWDENREIYIFIDLGDVANNQALDIARIIPRLEANIFNNTQVSWCVILSKRLWDESLRRSRLTHKGIFAPETKDRELSHLP